MVTCKQEIPQDCGDTHLQHIESEGQKCANICSVCGQTAATKQPSGSSSEQIHDVSYQEMQHSYKELEATNKDVKNLNRYLEKEVQRCHTKLHAYIALEKKKRLAEEKHQLLIQRNSCLQQKIIETVKKLCDYTALEDVYESVKTENKTLSQTKFILYQQVHEVHKTLFKQNHLEEKIKKRQEENEALILDNINLQRQVEDLTEKLRDTKGIVGNYEALESAIKNKTEFKYSLQGRLQDLNEQYEKVKPQVEKCHKMKANIDAVQKENEILIEEICELQDKVTFDKALTRYCDGLLLAKVNVNKENHDLQYKIGKLRKELQNFEGVEDKFKGTSERDLMCRRRSGLKKSLRTELRAHKRASSGH